MYNRHEFKDKETVLTAEIMQDIEDGICANEEMINENKELIYQTQNLLDNTISENLNSFVGNPVSVKDSKEAPLEVLKIYGKTEQYTTSGKNFAYFNNTARTHRGVTFTPVNDEKGLLEYVLVNGTNDGTGESVYTISSNLLSHLVLGTKYIMNGCPSGGSSSTYRLQHWGYSDSNAVHDYGNGVEYTFNDADDNGNVSIIVSSGVTVSNLKFYPMIRLATITDGTYEPFTNGPSPNPDYPQEVKGVKGKNLLDCSGLTEQTINGVTFTPIYNKQGLLEYVNVNGVNDGVGTSVFAIPITLEANTDYILNGCPSGGDASKYRLYIANTDNSTAGLDYGGGATVNTGEVTSWVVRLRIESGVTVSNLKFYPMIRKASIADGSYVPYGCLKIKAVGKNLLNQSALLQGTISADDGYTLGTSASILYSPYFTELKRGESYIFNIRNSIRIYKYDKHQKFIESVIVTNAFIADCEYIRYQSNNFTEESQLEIGTVSTEYEPYKENSVFLPIPEMHGFGGVVDYIDTIRGVLVQKFIKRNNLTFKLASGYKVGNSELFMCGAGDGANKATIVSNVLPFNHHGTLNNNTNGAYQLYGTIYARIKGVSDVNEFNNLIANNEFVYELAEPIETPLSVESIKELQSFEGYTHVIVDSFGEIEVLCAKNDLEALALKKTNNLEEKIEKEVNKLDSEKLPLSGGTMTGNLNSQNVYPVEGSTYNCGSSDRPFQSVVSNNLYSIGSNEKIYGRLQATTQGTATTQGYGDLFVGNSYPTGTDGNAKGRLLVFNSGANYAVIQDDDSATTNRTLTLPRVTGQIPVVSVSGTTLNINF